MICDVYGCDMDYWDNRVTFLNTEYECMTETDFAFDDFHIKLGLVHTASLTANQLKEIK